MFLLEIELPNPCEKSFKNWLVDAAVEVGVDEIRAVRTLSAKDALTLAFTIPSLGVEFHAMLRSAYPSLKTLVFSS